MLERWKCRNTGDKYCINKEHKCRSDKVQFWNHLTHYLQFHMQALPAHFIVHLQPTGRVQFPGIVESALNALCACIEDFRLNTGPIKMSSIFLNLNFCSCSVKKNPSIKKRHWSTALSGDLHIRKKKIQQHVEKKWIKSCSHLLLLIDLQCLQLLRQSLKRWLAEKFKGWQSIRWQLSKAF